MLRSRFSNNPFSYLPIQREMQRESADIAQHAVKQAFSISSNPNKIASAAWISNSEFTGCFFNNML
jgi:transcription initiation factor TFIIIB Brf1 subunit/transcription initiation factor TFIIB